MPYKDPEKAKAKARASHKAWREANPERVKAANKAYYDANRERLKAHVKKYCNDNPEKVKAIKKAWWDANPEKVKAFRNCPLNASARHIYALTGLKKSEIPTDLLEAQALIISINREIRNNEKLHRA